MSYEYGDDFVAFRARNCSGKSTPAAVAILVGQESPHLTIAQAGLVKAHVRPDVGSVEVKPTTEFVLAPLGVAAQLIAVQVSEILAVYAVHLRYVLNRQGCRLHLRLLKKPRTRH